MVSNGLLFIPDISGFSRYVHQTEIEHSRLIIQELLETLIDSNRIGLEISEIEGDAILFYRLGELPDLPTLAGQVEEMFCAFQRNVRAYDLRRYCQCQACTGVRNLTLKVITHYGEFTGYTVKEFSKLFGRDVIVAHELLKNDIEHHEYWLATRGVVQHDPLDSPAPWIAWREGTKETQVGEVPFRYTALAALRDSVPPETVRPAELRERVRVLQRSEVLETDIITLFHATGDFCYRSRWQEDVRGVEEIDHLLPRVGMRCRFLRSGGDAVVSSSSYEFRSDRIEFTETEEATGRLTRYLLERVEAKRTRLTLEYYVPRRPGAELIFPMTQGPRMARMLDSSMRNLAALVPELRIPTAVDA